jgi:hypothetical protein
MAKVEDRLRYDKDTTRLVLAYTEGIDPNVQVMCPDIEVPTSGQYMSYPKGNFKFSGDTTRGIGDTTVKELKIAGGTWLPYFLIEHPLFASLDRLEGRSGMVQNIVETSLVKKGNRVKEALDQEWSGKVITLAQTINASYKTTPSTKWNAASGQAPIADIRAACIAVAQNCGRWPNNMLITASSLVYLADYARSHFNINTINTDQQIIEKLVMPHLNIKNLLISDARSYGGTTYDEVWGAKGACWVFYSKKSPVIEDVTFMANLVPDDVPAYRQLPPYQDLHQTSKGMIQGIREYDPRFICESAGYWLYDVLT